MVLLFVIFGVSLFFDSHPSAQAYYQNGVVHVEKAVKHFNGLEGITWTAHHNELGHNFTLSSIKSKLGLLPETPVPVVEDESETEEDIDSELLSFNDGLPKYYDLRDAYPQCTTISSVKDQSNCEACWAISVAAVLSDRLCIHSHGKINKNISSNYLLSCNIKNDGCDGGKMGVAWDFVKDNGLVTGGDYGSFEGCQPYSIKPKATLQESRYAPDALTPKCRRTRCTNKLYKREEDVLYKVSNVTRLPADEYEIRKEIFKNGPVTAGMEVRVSFMLYKNGIYQTHPSDPFIGLHAVRVIGWGKENGVEYWICVNSWGPRWGDNGFFKIKRGSDNAQIETMVHAAMPNIDKDRLNM